MKKQLTVEQKFRRLIRKEIKSLNEETDTFKSNILEAANLLEKISADILLVRRLLKVTEQKPGLINMHAGSMKSELNSFITNQAVSNSWQYKLLSKNLIEMINSIKAG